MIHGQTIDLRLVRESDLQELHALWQDIDARGLYYPRNLEPWVRFRRRYDETGFWTDEHGAMAITDKDGELLAQITFFTPSTYHDALEIAYIVLKPERRGQGIMSDALRLFSGYLFETKKVNRLQLTVVPGNEASRRVAEKAGFRSEGILREAIFLRGRNQDLELFSLLRREWLAASTAAG